MRAVSKSRCGLLGSINVILKFGFNAIHRWLELLLMGNDRQIDRPEEPQHVGEKYLVKANSCLQVVNIQKKTRANLKRGRNKAEVEALGRNP